jgi:GLPGLI family protein
MKNNLILLVLILSGMKVFCQNDSSYNYKVAYEMQLNFSEPTSYKSSFFFNKSQSLFEYKEDFPDNEDVEQVEDKDGNIKFYYHDKSIRYIRTNKVKNLIRESKGTYEKNEPFEIEESIPVIAWNISEETKKINQHDCNKATCSFKGRNYTVWFTPDIQTGFGPIKLNGLPGLILEVSDDTKEVVLYAKAIIKEEKKIENEPSGIKVIPMPEFKKSVVKDLKKMEEYGKILSSQMGRGLKVSYKISKPKSIEMDYDIDVPEK